MGAPPTRAKFYGVLAIVAASTPLAMLVETGLRQVMFPPEFDEVRMWLRPTITPWVWLAPVASILAVPLGDRLQRALVRRELLRLPPERRTEAERVACEFDALLLSTSAPQIPAVIATLAFMCGAGLAPVIAAMIVATAGVLALGASVTRRIHPPP
ncbi:MAG: hypothetical protein JNK45_02085 [Myxococcales bacterium]|nr:hypothetical protein [Myxococcales bacterium]